MNEIKVLDLFSGIGGFSLGLERAGPFRTVAFCEREPFCQAVLQKHWPDTPIYDDVRTIDTDGLGKIDLICGGFPCQPWSVAGQQRGAEDDRDLWPEMVRLVEELQPRWLIGENVRGFVNKPMGLQRSLSDLESIGYQAVPFIIPACAVDAPHRRDRVWIVANSEGIGHIAGREQRDVHKEDGGQVGERCSIIASASKQSENMAEILANAERDSKGARKKMDRSQTKWRKTNAEPSNGGQDVADAEQSRSSSESIGDIGSVEKEISREEEGRNQSSIRTSTRSTDVADAESRRVERDRAARQQKPQTPLRQRLSGRDSAGSGAGHWATEPSVGRVATGVPRRVDRLRALGNAVVPQVVEKIGRAIMSASVDED